MQSIGFNIIYPHPFMKLFFLAAVSAGFQAGELGEIHFGLGATPVKWCENVGKIRKSYAEQLQNQLLFQIKQTIYFILVQKWTKMRVRISVNSSNIEANRAQVTYPFTVSLLYISAMSKISYTSELGTAVLHVWQVCWFWSMSPYSWLQQKVSLQPAAQPLQRRMSLEQWSPQKSLRPNLSE